jgi:hypothetical protein
MTKLRSLTSAAFIGLSLLAPLAGLGMGPAPASATPTSTLVQAETPRLTPWGGGYYWPLARGTTVTMNCWTTGPNVDGGAKWFQITSDQYPYQSGGYVPANSVGRQTIVGHC